MELLRPCCRQASRRLAGAAAERGRGRGWVRRAACASGASRGADGGLPLVKEEIVAISCAGGGEATTEQRIGEQMVAVLIAQMLEDIVGEFKIGRLQA